MKKWMHLSGAVALALIATACAGDNAERNSDAAKGNDAAVGTSGSAGGKDGGTTATTNARADMEFVQEQLAMGEAEIAAGQLAQQRGTHPEVKRFGEMMVRDHRMSGQELKEVLASANKSATGTAAATESARKSDAHKDHQESLAELKELKGAEFDREYINLMIQDHEKGVRDVEKQAENADNAPVRQWAAKTLPKMQQHLERAKTIQETLEQSRSDRSSKPKSRG